MQSIIDGCTSGRINGSVVLVIGTKDDAPAMDRARTAGIKTAVISPKEFSDTDQQDTHMLSVLQNANIDLVCLAGYMRLLGPKCVETYKNRIMNVHPALLPSFCGEGMFGHHVHEAVIARGARISGATVHFVDEKYDTGPIIVQAIVGVEDSDTPDTLAAKVLEVEHKAYPDAIALFAEDRLEVDGLRVKVREIPG
jgi:phosphoribosylglycinamide formyltransferase-1